MCLRAQRFRSRSERRVIIDLTYYYYMFPCSFPCVLSITAFHSIATPRLYCEEYSQKTYVQYRVVFGVRLRSPVLVATAPRGPNPIAFTPPPSYPCTRNVHHLFQRHYGK